MFCLTLKRINYITNIPFEEASGGWSGMNYHICRQLAQRLDVHAIQDINPAYILHERIVSKVRRQLGMTSLYPAFTHTRLQQIASMVESKIDKTTSMNFFHGATPWIHVKSDLPYALYMDACFATYIDIYHDKSLFNEKQLSSIYKKEISFLQKAGKVFFSSLWALNDTKKRYQIEGKNFLVAGLGGYLANNKSNGNKNGLYFLFAGLDFIGKGGDKVVRAFKKIHATNPQYSLKIAGQKPPNEYLNNDGVEYVGFFDKSKPSDFDNLTRLFSEATAFVLPTSKDITPLVIIEAGSVGCPVISVNNFGIPEMVKHMETGILVEQGENLEWELQKAMLLLAEDNELRNRLGTNSRTYVSEYFNWNRTGEFIFNGIL